VKLLPSWGVYPARPVRVIVATAAGATTDITAHLSPAGCRSGSASDSSLWKGDLMQVTPLFHVTGDPDDQRCYNCGISLAKQRCAGNTTAGPKWFCRQDPESEPDQSCYSFWKMRQPRERRRS
jgi:hypothetical protein